MVEPNLTVVGGLLLKSSASLGADWVKRAASRRVLRWRAARSASKALASEGLEVPSGLLRRWMLRKDVQTQLGNGGASQVSSAQASLRSLLGTSERPFPQEQVDRVILVLVRELIRFAHPGDALAAQTEVAIAHHDSLVTEIHRAADSTRAGVSADRRRARAEAEVVPKFHAWRREAVLELAETSQPGFEALLALAQDPDTRETLSHWVSEWSQRLDEGSAEMLALLGAIAQDFGLSERARDLFSAAIKRGVADESRLRARWVLTYPREARWLDEMENASGGVERAHPLATAAIALATGESARAREVLEGSAFDRAEDQSSASLLLAQSWSSEGDVDRMVRTLDDAVKDSPVSGGIRLALARALLARAKASERSDHYQDLSRAVSFALDARDLTRSWGGESARAVEVAVEACLAGGDWQRAQRLVLVSPEGEALQNEARDPGVRAIGAITFALAKDATRATELANVSGDNYTVEAVRGYLADEAGDGVEAERAWRAAFSVATDLQKQITAAQNLAMLGATLPDLEELGATHPDAVAELYDLQRVMAAGDVARKSLLRAKSTQSKRYATLYVLEIIAGAATTADADALHRLGVRWSDPDFERMAARTFLLEKDHDRAVECADHALSFARTSWGNRPDALAVKFQALEAMGQHDAALVAARALHEAAPSSPDAAWAYARSLARAGQIDEAWNVLDVGDVTFAPRDGDEARAWIHVACRTTVAPRNLERALEYADKLSEDDDDYAALLAMLVNRVTGSDVDVDQSSSDAVMAALAGFVAAHPENQVLRAVSVPTDGDPVQMLAELLRGTELPPQIKAAEDEARRGAAPLGLIAEIHRRSYTEAVVRRAAGLVYARDVRDSGAGSSSFARAVEEGAVLDVSAAATLALFDDELFGLVLGSVAGVTATHSSVHDADTAIGALRGRSTLSASLGEDGAPRLDELADDHADWLAVQAVRVRDVLASAQLTTWTRTVLFPGNARLRSAWADGPDLALSTEIPLWSDDRVQRHLTVQKGGAAFGTLDVLDSLEALGVLTAQRATIARALLITHFYVDFAFDAETFRHALNMDGGIHRGLIAQFARPALWEDPKMTLRFGLDALVQAQGDPEEVTQWAGALATGLIRYGGVVAQAQANVNVLLEAVVLDSRVEPHAVPFVLSGVRLAADQNPLQEAKVTIDIRSALERRHTALRARLSPAEAASNLLTFVRYLPDHDRHAAVDVVMREN